MPASARSVPTGCLTPVHRPLTSAPAPFSLPRVLKTPRLDCTSAVICFLLFCITCCQTGCDCPQCSPWAITQFVHNSHHGCCNCPRRPFRAFTREVPARTIAAGGASWLCGASWVDVGGQGGCKKNDILHRALRRGLTAGKRCGVALVASFRFRFGVACVGVFARSARTVQTET